MSWIGCCFFLYFFFFPSGISAPPLDRVPNLLPQFLPGVYQNRQLSKLPDFLIYLNFWCNTLKISAVHIPSIITSSQAHIEHKFYYSQPR
ncbi:hypothetical protein BDV35DRAFT_375009 [Aspergillus flavus]|uniref:Secreted protein n=1 Tax=Aspergillus flavus TaxID=5059 RepID=A0A5N6GBX5_ASPFL|nr:hypothetical protein BDV35DRAFT_375009 [Aspergillus flavus]